jgi:hypothetical protein
MKWAGYMGSAGEKSSIYGILLDRTERERNKMEYVGIHRKKILKLYI